MFHGCLARGKSGGPGVSKNLNGVADGDGLALLFEVGGDLGEAADVAGGDEIGLGGDDGLGFVLPK